MTERSDLMALADWLEGMRDQPPTDEADDRGYWEHELRAFDRTFDALKNEGVS